MAALKMSLRLITTASKEERITPRCFVVLDAGSLFSMDIK